MTGRLSILLHSLSVRRGRKWVLRQISWQLEPGERWALLGDNGAGKTQLLKLLSGAVWPTPVAARASDASGAGDASGASGAGADGRSYRRGSESLPLLEAKAYMAYVGGELQDK